MMHRFLCIIRLVHLYQKPVLLVMNLGKELKTSALECVYVQQSSISGLMHLS